MTKEIRSTNIDRIRTVVSELGIRNSFVISHSEFVILLSCSFSKNPLQRLQLPQQDHRLLWCFQSQHNRLRTTAIDSLESRFHEGSVQSPFFSKIVCSHPKHHKYVFRNKKS